MQSYKYITKEEKSKKQQQIQLNQWNRSAILLVLIRKGKIRRGALKQNSKTDLATRKWFKDILFKYIARKINGYLLPENLLNVSSIFCLFLGIKSSQQFEKLHPIYEMVWDLILASQNDRIIES